MIKDSVIVIPSQEKRHEICDFLYQTAQILTRHNMVIILQLKESYSIKEILVNIITKKKYFKLLEKKQNILYLKPIFIIPFRRFDFIYNLNLKINCLLLQILIKIRNPNKRMFLWMFFPHEEKITIYFSKKWFLIYDIVDFYTLPTQKDDKKLEAKKRKLLNKSDLITAISNSLKNKYQKLTDKHIYQVPQGFNLIEDFHTHNYKKNNKPLIGFIGHINNRFDLTLLTELITKNKQWNFVFIGPKHHDNNISYEDQSQKIEKLFQLRNAFWIKQQPKKNITKFIKRFDICIIPYNIEYDFNKFCYPMKIFEYFAIGKPVVSTPIQELLLPKFNDIIRIGNNSEEWEYQINDILKKGWPNKLSTKQRQMSSENSWGNKLEEMSKLIKL